MSEQLVESKWFQKWTWKTVGWSFLCFLGLSAVNGLLGYFLANIKKKQSNELKE